MQPKCLMALKVIFTCILWSPYSLIMCFSNWSAFLTELSPFCALCSCLYDENSWTLHTNMPTVKWNTHPVRCHPPPSPAPAWCLEPASEPFLRCLYRVSLSDRGSTASLRLPIEKLLLFYTTFCRNYFRFLKTCCIIPRFPDMRSELDRSRFQRCDTSWVLYVECVFLIFLSVLL